MASKRILWILWLVLFTWKWNYLNCFEIQKGDSVNEVDCQYDLVSGGRICDCGFQNVDFVMPRGEGNVYQFIVTNCKSLRLRRGTFRNIATITRIVFNNIENLVLEEYSVEFPLRFPLPKVKITLNNVTISQITSHAFSGSIDYIEFINCRIGVIQPYAINCLSNPVYRISFDKTLIDHLENQAFKKMTIEQLEFTNTTFLDQIPSKAFYDLSINDFFTVDGCKFSKIASSAFMFDEINRFIFKYNEIDRLDGEAFNMNIKESITFQYNFFKDMDYLSFRTINVHSEYRRRRSEPMEFGFTSNLIQTIEHPMYFIVSPDFRLNIKQLKFTLPMTCSSALQLENNNFLRQFGDTVYFKLGSETSDTELKYYSLIDILTKECILTTKIIAGIAAAVILLLILIIVSGVFCYRYINERKKATQLNIINPEGKTYRETQIMMQIENAGLLKTDL